MSEEQQQDPKQQKISLPGDTVTQALNRLVANGELDEEARADVWWFYAYAQENNMTIEEAGRAINASASTAHRIFTGTYGAKYDALVDAIRKFRTLQAARGNRKKIGFIETGIWAKIDAVCRHALHEQIPVFIFGDS